MTCHTSGLLHSSHGRHHAASAGPWWHPSAPGHWVHPDTPHTGSSRSGPESPCWFDLNREGKEMRCILVYLSEKCRKLLKKMHSRETFEQRPFVSTSLACAHSVLPSDVRIPKGGRVSSAFSAIFIIFSSWDKISVSLNCLLFATTSNTKN